MDQSIYLFSDLCLLTSLAKGKYMHNLHHKPKRLAHWVSILHRMRNVYFEHELKPHGIGHGQDRILSILFHVMIKDGHKEVTQVDLARILHLDKANVTRSMKKLERKGFLTRSRSEEDNRQYNITLTPKAIDFSKTLRGKRKKWTRVLAKGFTADEKKAAITLLEKMAENAHDFLHEYRQKKGEK